MKKSFACLAVLIAGLPLVARGSDYIFKQPNNIANYIKLEKIKNSKAEELKITQPYTFTVEQLTDMLRSLRFSRKVIFSDKEKIRDVFEMEYINKFVPLLIEAFSKAKPNQVVLWSIVQKRPYVIIRNDHLTQVKMWVSGSELHIHFAKVEAKLQGDYQARTTGERIIEAARGIRIGLEPQSGQKFALDSTEEIILDINANWGAIADALDAEDERIKEEEEAKKKRKKTAKADASAPPAAAAAPTTPVAPPAPLLSVKDQKNAEQRLIELKKLKDKGLISDDDYNKKKDEILQGL